ncbi:MAG TPA: endo-1,4-beta-xylanase [Brevundimonas sp.]|jgi:endo-1,4-beta-xylanase|uniref:endo-1,4-beta-xylanase n=1 Tax=Brevundimonas sp. TaxID=1871086 RepID=UPI002DEF6203|nr:endo-1,4-beta-xylanase [Brevundimonas sp.]
MATRRSVLSGSLALAACAGAPAAPAAARPLKDMLPCPAGVCGMSGQFAEAGWRDLVVREFSQFTPEWEMKMEAILRPDGSLDFSRADVCADFAARHGLRLHGHALIWYSQGADQFAGLDKAAFGEAYDRYVLAVTSRYRGKVVSWDVVNEAVAEDGDGLRSHHWSQALGEIDHIRRAFDVAHTADPQAVLFLNDYNLENLPRKGATFLRLVETLLKAGTPVHGIGTQSHLDVEIAEGQIAGFFREAAEFGLQIHVSELDASLKSDRRLDLRPDGQRRAQQAARVTELTEAFMALPAAQRFAFTVWGARDPDSWLNRDARAGSGDEPLLFDASGAPTSMHAAVVGALPA